MRSGPADVMQPGGGQGLACLAELHPVLDMLCPMHFIIAPDGDVLHAGPTLEKLCKGRGLVGYGVLDLFEVIRPRQISSPAQLLDTAPGTLRLSFRQRPKTGFKGCIVRCGGAR